MSLCYFSTVFYLCLPLFNHDMMTECVCVCACACAKPYLKMYACCIDNTCGIFGGTVQCSQLFDYLHSCVFTTLNKTRQLLQVRKHAADLQLGSTILQALFTCNTLYLQTLNT